MDDTLVWEAIESRAVLHVLFTLLSYTYCSVCVDERPY